MGSHVALISVEVSQQSEIEVPARWVEVPRHLPYFNLVELNSTFEIPLSTFFAHFYCKTPKNVFVYSVFVFLKTSRHLLLEMDRVVLHKVFRSWTRLDLQEYKM